MKKTILTITALSSIIGMANITGSIETEFKNSNKFDIYQKDTKFGLKEYKIDKTKTIGKVTLDNGFTFGATLEGNDIILPKDKDVKNKLFEDSNLFVEYDKKGGNFLAKGVLKKHQAEVSIDTMNDKLTDKVRYTYGAKLQVPFDFENKNYREKLILTNKVGFETTNAKGNLTIENNFSEIKTGNYTNNAEKQGITHHTLEQLIAEFEAKHGLTDNLTFKMKNNLTYALNKNKIEYVDSLREKDDVFKSFTSGNAAKGKLFQNHMVGLTYTGIKNLKLDDELFVQHLNKNEINGSTTKNKLNNLPKTHVRFGTKFGVEYKPIENLTLTSKTIIGGGLDTKKEFKDDLDIKKGSNVYKDWYGYISEEIGSKYDYKPTENLTITPEVKAKAVADRLNLSNKNYDFTTDSKQQFALTIEPKATVKYEPISKLEIMGELSTPIDFSNRKYNGTNKYHTQSSLNKVDKFKFNSINVKTGLDIKYSW